MRLNLTDKTVVFDRETVRQLLEIEECKGAWKAFGNLPPDRLTELWRIATIESVGASTRIEGAKLSDKEVAASLRTSRRSPSRRATSRKRRAVPCS